MAITKYKTNSVLCRIEKVEVLRETADFVYLAHVFGEGERRQAKNSGHESFWNTWDEAHSELLGFAERQLMAARRHLQRAQDEFGKVKGMKGQSPC